MDCEECVERLDQLVDRELSGPEVDEVLHHLSNCGDCTRRYEFNAGLKRLVKVSCSERAPEALRQRLEQLLRY